eukprot:scaffold209798_cov30-Tisochrysis_lutea.AAC.1
MEQLGISELTVVAPEVLTHHSTGLLSVTFLYWAVLWCAICTPCHTAHCVSSMERHRMVRSNLVHSLHFVRCGSAALRASYATRRPPLSSYDFTL